MDTGDSHSPYPGVHVPGRATPGPARPSMRSISCLSAPGGWV